ncbi:MAG: HD-GYP domain-containing protein [Pseudomonadota bacterium]|nr:HD-GYP domain-containing protein [Pseudomonadota bacterium]
MNRKIDTHELRKGMYVCELDRPWVGTPFLFQGFEIRSDDEIETLRSLCQYVYITDIPPRTATPRPRTAAPAPPSAADPATATHANLLSAALRNPTAPPRYHDLVTLEEEVAAAREIESNTRELIYSIMDDVRLGHSLDAMRAKKAVGGMVESVVRNPDALVWLTQLKNRDAYTALHSLRVCILALTFGRHLDLSTEELNLLGTGALLHDIGKLRISPEILNKPARLTDEEYAIMKSHVPIGVGILDDTRGIPAPAIAVARFHHERYSGAGYINGITGDQIGLFGLIGAIVDAYDAITSDRAYHDGLSAYDALKKLYDSRGKDFHPGLVEQFIQCMGIYPIGSIVELNTGSVGVVITVNRDRRLRPKVVVVLDENKRPHPVAPVLDLSHTGPDSGGTIIEIRQVLPAGAFKISANSYLPLAKV